MSFTYSAGVVGCGRMGIRHVQALQQLGFFISGVVDTHSAALTTVSKECNLNASVLYTSLDNLFKESHPDLLVIATTASSHCQYVEDAARKGVRYILCEKPMAVSLAECNHMIKVCQQSKSILAINHPMRFMPAYQTLHKLINNGAIGKFASLSIISGNLGIAMNGSHFLEGFRFITNGETLHQVQTDFSEEIVPNPRGKQYVDRGGIVRGKSIQGSRFYLDCSTNHGHSVMFVCAGSDGMIYADILNGYIRHVARKEEFLGYPSAQYALPATLDEIYIGSPDIISVSKQMAQALLEENNYMTGEEGRSIIETLVKMHHSAENGGKIVSSLNSTHTKRQFPWA